MIAFLSFSAAKAFAVKIFCLRVVRLFRLGHNCLTDKDNPWKVLEKQLMTMIMAHAKATEQ